MSTKSLVARIEPKRRAADLAYDRIEALISKLQIAPGSAVVESEIAELTQLGRTPVREALMRMTAIGLIVQQPRRGLSVSTIDVVDHLNLIETRRALERLIASNSARRANAEQRKNLVRCAEKMMKAGGAGNIDQYMAADQELDHVNHAASGTDRQSKLWCHWSCNAAAFGTATRPRAKLAKAHAFTWCWPRPLRLARKPKPQKAPANSWTTWNALRGG